MKHKLGEVRTSKSGRTKYAIVAFIRNGERVRQVVYTHPRKVSRGVVRDGYARRLRRKLKLRA